MDRKTIETSRQMAQKPEPAADKRSPLNTEAFAELHRRYKDRLIHSVTAFLKNVAKAEDIAAQAFEAAWEKRGAFRGDASPYTWIQAIARNAARSELRGRTDPVDPTELNELTAPPADPLEQEENSVRLRAALAQLPLRHRSALVGHFIDGLSIRDVAHREQIPYGTALTRIFTAKQLLRRIWQTQDARSLDSPQAGGNAAVLRMYQGRRNMPSDKVRKIAEEALNQLSAELEAGRSGAFKNCLAAMGRFHKYSWGNVLLINSQRPDAKHVAGFHTWHDLGRSVNKGEKGIMILAPVMVKQRNQEDRVPVGKESSKPDSIFRLAGFRTAYVFDVSQTQGKPLPEFAKTTGDAKDNTDKLKAIVAKSGISIEYDAKIAPALGTSSGGRIRVVPGLEPAEEFSVLAHELAHEMLHHRKDAVRPPQTVRETQAEAVAFVVCRGVGLETNNAASDYIALYNGDKKTLADSLAAIQETSTKILDELLSEKRVPSPEQSSRTGATHENRVDVRDSAREAHAPSPDRAQNLTSPAPEQPVWDR